MSFREIRPSFGESSASISNPSNSTSESTGSGPPKARSGKVIESSSSNSSKRRRVPESVTRNACVNCKKARAKVCPSLATDSCLMLGSALDPNLGSSVMERNLARDVPHEWITLNVSMRSISNMQRRNWSDKSRN